MTDMERFALQVARRAIQLEAKGMKHSRLGSVKAKWAVKFGLSPRAKHADVIQRIEQELRCQPTPSST